MDHGGSTELALALSLAVVGGCSGGESAGGVPEVLGAGSDVRLGVAEDGTAVAVWRDGDALVATSRAPGQAWASAAVLDDDVRRDQHWPLELAVASSGHAVATWPEVTVTASDPNGSRGEVELRAVRFTPGAGWGTPETITTLGGAILPWLGSAEVAIAADGTASFAFTEGFSTLSVAHQPAIGAWGAPEVVTSNALGEIFLAEVALVAEPSGAALAWVDRGSRTGQLARFTRGSGWGAPASISIAGTPHFQAGIATDDAIVVSGAANGGTFAVASDGAGWAPLELLDPRFTRTQLAGSSDTAVALLLGDGILEMRQLEAARWGDPRRLATDVLAAAIAASASGHVVVGWRDPTGDWLQHRDGSDPIRLHAEPSFELLVGVGGDGVAHVLVQDGEGVISASLVDP